MEIQNLYELGGLVSEEGRRMKTRKSLYPLGEQHHLRNGLLKDFSEEEKLRSREKKNQEGLGEGQLSALLRFFGQRRKKAVEGAR